MSPTVPDLEVQIHDHLNKMNLIYFKTNFKKCLFQLNKISSKFIICFVHKQTYGHFLAFLICVGFQSKMVNRIAMCGQ